MSVCEREREREIKQSRWRFDGFSGTVLATDFFLLYYATHQTNRGAYRTFRIFKLNNYYLIIHSCTS